MESTSPTRLLLQHVVKGQPPHSHLPHPHLSTLADVFLVVLSTLYRLGDAFSDSLARVKHRNERLKESHREKRRATCHSSFPIILLTTAMETGCSKHCVTLFRSKCAVRDGLSTSRTQTQTYLLLSETYGSVLLSATSPTSQQISTTSLLIPVYQHCSYRSGRITTLLLLHYCNLHSCFNLLVSLP